MTPLYSISYKFKFNRNDSRLKRCREKVFSMHLPRIMSENICSEKRDGGEKRLNCCKTKCTFYLEKVFLFFCTSLAEKRIFGKSYCQTRRGAVFPVFKYFKALSLSFSDMPSRVTRLFQCRFNSWLSWFE